MAAVEESELDGPEEKSARDALPAGHPLAWGVLVNGTSLAGMTWPGWGARSATPPETV